jgi:glutathione S-transferase
MPVLYSSDLSPYAARVRLAVYWKGLENRVVFEVPPGGLKSEEYKAINPLGKIPALKLDSGFCLPESELIVEYLEDAYPIRPLRPAGAENVARARLAARIADLYLAPGLAPLFLNADPSSRDAAAVEEGFSTVGKALSDIESFLDETGPWSMGRQPTTADCTLAPVFWFIAWADAWYQRSTLADNPACARVFETASQDEAASRVFAELERGLKARFGG